MPNIESLGDNPFSSLLTLNCMQDSTRSSTILFRHNHHKTSFKCYKLEWHNTFSGWVCCKPVAAELILCLKREGPQSEEIIPRPGHNKRMHVSTLNWQNLVVNRPFSEEFNLD